jgi:hypothetical protein
MERRDDMNGSKVKNTIGFIVCLLILAVLAYFMFFEDKGVRRGIKGIPEPVQTEASGGTSFSKAGYDVNIEYKYSYEIEALVVHTHKYGGTGLGDQLSPLDLGLAWGKVAEYNDKIDFHWSQGNRWLNWETDSYNDIAVIGGENEVMRQASNNHIIPADTSVKRKVMKIRAGDRVRLTGYLVNVNAEKPNGTTFWWNSSTSRDDTGAHACEVFYVTKVEVDDD